MSLCTEKPSQCVYIQSLINERKYKLVFRGDICLLGTERIKRYIEKSIGIPAAQQELTFNGKKLLEGSSGDSIGLYNNAVLHLQHASPSACDLSLNCASQRTTSPTKSPTPEDMASRSPITPLHSSCNFKTVTTKGVPHRSTGSEGVTEYQPLERLEWEDKLGAHSDPHFDGLGVSRRSRGSNYARRNFLESHLTTQFTTDQALFLPASSHSRRDNATELARGGSTTEARSEAVREGGVRNGNLSRYEVPEDRQLLPEGGQNARRCSMPDETESIRTSVSGSLAPYAHQGQQYAISIRSGSHRVGSHLTDRYLPVLKAENQALTRENELLQEKLLEAERRAANATSDWQLKEEVLVLKETLEAADKEKQKAVDAAHETWRHKEAELIAELDLLRKERDQAHAVRESHQDEQQRQITSLQSELQSQRDEIRAKEETIRQLHFTLAELQSKQDPRQVSPVPARSLDELVQGSLEGISRVLEAPPIKLDDKGTCIINMSDELNIFLTLDSESERLHVYAMLLDRLPVSEEVRLQLYEKLLEGTLLGRDTAGGTIGISKEDGVVLLSISVDVRRSDEDALAHLARPFVESVKRWQRDIQGMLPIS
ncbi:unnamed protein product, partial [Phytomonas sp. EM1]